MKICYLADINNYHTIKWCSYFASKGYEIIVISLSNGKIKGCKTYCFKYQDVKKLSTIEKIGYLKNIKKIKEIIYKEKPDILHSHYASSYGLIGNLTKFKPHIVSLWGSDIYIFPRKSFLHKLIIKKVLNGTNHIFSTSRCMSEEASKYIKKDIIIPITPFGVNIDLFKSYGKKKHDSFIIGVNKSLEKISGIDILLKAYKKFKEENPEVNSELRIAGKGSQYGELSVLARELNIEKDVIFYGFLNEQKIVEFLNKLDLAIYPSRSESFGVSAIEAQACELPVIASDVDGFKESTIPNETALLFKKEDVENLYKLIQLIYDNPCKRKTMGLQGRSYVEKNFNLQDNFNYVDRLYQKIILDNI